MKLLVFLAVIISCAAAQSLDFTNFRRCAKIWMEAYCTDYAPQVRSHLDASLHCNNIYSNFRNQIANTCTRDGESGLYCGAAFAYSTAINALPFTCSSTIAGGNCTSGCRNSLIDIRNELGCCINTIVNTTWSAFSFALSGFSYDLWSTCEVDPPNSSCSDPLPFTVPTTPQQSNCRPEEFLGCMPSTQDAVRETIAGESACESIEQYFSDLCSRDIASNTFCIDAIFTTDITTLTNAIQTTCDTATQTCSTDCKMSLNQFVDTHPGCCANAIYNSTYAMAIGLNHLAPFLRDNSLFQVCDVDTPPMSCSVSAGLPLKGSMFVALLALFANKMIII